MRELRNIAPIGIFIVAQFTYDNFAPLRSTNWSIFYFSCQYLAFAILALNLAHHSNIKKNMPYFILSSGFFFYVIRNIAKINCNYDDFIVSVNNAEANILLNLYIIVSLLIVLLKCHK